MTRYYVSHYFDFKNIGIFLLVSLIGLIAVLAIVLITAKLQVHRRLNYEGLDECNVAEITRRHRFREIGMIESFYEISGFYPVAFSDSVSIFHRMAGSFFSSA